MKYCTSCGGELPEYTKAFCPNCGGRVSADGTVAPKDTAATGATPDQPQPQHPRTRRWMVWTAVGLLVLAGVGTGTYFLGRGGDSTTVQGTAATDGTGTSTTAEGSSGVGTTILPADASTEPGQQATTPSQTTNTSGLVGQLPTQRRVGSVTRYEESEPLLKWTGLWSTFPDDDASGGGYSCAWGDASVLVRFQGTSISLLALKFEDEGIAKLTLDNVDTFLVDLYGPKGSRDFQKVWSSPTLANGAHFLLIETTGTKNPAAWNTRINFDAVDVAGTLL
jgi:hypothetical protein